MAEMKVPAPQHPQAEQLPMAGPQQNFNKTTGFLKATSSSNSAAEDPLQMGAPPQQFAETQNQFFMGSHNSSNHQTQSSVPHASKTQSPPTEGVTRIFDGDNSVFTVNQVIATSGEVQRIGQPGQRASK